MCLSTALQQGIDDVVRELLTGMQCYNGGHPDCPMVSACQWEKLFKIKKNHHHHYHLS